MDGVAPGAGAPPRLMLVGAIVGTQALQWLPFSNSVAPVPQ